MQRSLLILITTVLLLAPPCYADAVYDQHITQAQAYDDAGDTRGAFTEYAAAYAAAPGPGAAATALIARMRSGAMPIKLPDSLLAKLIDLDGPIATHIYDNGAVIAIGPANEIAATIDPRSAWPFTRVLWLYRRSDKQEGERICFGGIRSQMQEDLPLALRMGRVLCLMREAMLQQTGQPPLCDGMPINVWLCRHETDAGGEQWRNNIYFYDVAQDRSSIEWLREIAHEYSHMAFPLIGGDYLEPEEWANGYYGERLILRWIARGAAGGPDALEKTWGQTFSGYANYERQKIDPPLALIHRYGISGEWLGKRNAIGMSYLFGLLLTIDDKAGAKALAALLWDLPQSGLVNPQLLEQGARDALASGGAGAEAN